MKKLLLLFLLAAVGLQGWATDWFINGDATPMGWTDNGNKHRVTAFIPQGEGTYVWIGKLVVGNEGFKIGQNFSGWGDYHPSSAGLLINEVGTDNIVSGGSDTKWKVSADGVYKLTITEGNPNTLKCEAFTPTITQDGDGYYQLGSAADLFEFAELVSHKGISPEANAKLTADIDYTAYPRSTIGRHEDISWAGTFDGQGHKITIALHDWMGRTGLFSYVYHPTIKNLWVDGTINMGNHNCAGGLGGRCAGNNTVIDGVLSTVTINDNQSGDGTLGGLFANVENDNVVISNCAFFGSINAPNRDGNGGLVAWCGSGANITFNNCLIAPASISWADGATVGRNKPKVNNCYYKGIPSNSFTYADESTLNTITDEVLASGEGCYLLNENASGAEHWYQTLPTTDTKPYPIATGHSKVYANGNLNCDGTPKSGVTYSNTEGETRDDHVYQNGFCSVCDAYQENAFTATDGWFEVSQPWQLRWMAVSVNEHNGTYGNANIKLTADIDYTAYTNQAAMIGKPSNVFKGVFDGQYHTVTVAFNNTEGEESGLFRRINGGTVKNLKVAGTITTNQKLAGGICSGIWQKGTITNCESSVTITDNGSGDATHGGILAAVHDKTNTGIHILNCLFSGSIDASNRTGSGGIIGWPAGGATEVQVYNCLVTGTITLKDDNNNDVIVRDQADVKNTYYSCALTNNLRNSKSATAVATGEAASGALCYKLNENVSGGENWFQTLGTDAQPTPFSNSAKVYANGSFLCDGVTPKEGAEVTYSNTNEAIIDPHVFGTDGVCTACLAAGEEATATDGVYQLTNAGKLLWWAQYVNAGHTNVNAVLTADVDLSAAQYTPAGNETNVYAGHFDGQGHSVTLALNNSEKDYQGLFGVVTDGVKIEKVIVKGSVSGRSFVGGIVGGTNGGSSNAKKTDIWYCGNEATITAENANGAGIIGVNMNGSASIILTNCYNKGNISGGYDSGALSGWLGGGWSAVRNCYNIGTVKNGESNATAFARNSGCSFTNCYYSQSSGTNTDGNPTMVEDADVASGELCAKLGYGFRQNLSGAETDTYPSFNFDHGFVTQIGNAGYSTMYNIHSDVTIPSDVEAFAGVVNGEYLSLTPISSKIKAGEPVILKGTAGLYNFMPTTDAEAAASNSLLGSNGSITGGDGIYALSQQSGEVGFYPVGDGVKIPEGKAYLQYTGGNAVKGFTFVFEDDATSINEELRMKSEESSIYNVAGQRINKMQKGINIVNGKKIAIK